MDALRVGLHYEPQGNTKMKRFKAIINENGMDGTKWAINEFLNDLWHPVSEEPEENKKLLVQYTNYMVEDDYEIDMNSPHVSWGYLVTTYNFKKWCYIEDLLPKGCEK